MFDKYSVHVAGILKNMEEERSKLNHPFVGSEHLLLSLLKKDKSIIKTFEKYNIDYNIFKEELISLVSIPKKNVSFNLYTPLLKRILLNAEDIAEEDNQSKVSPKHLIISMLEEGEGVAIRILTSLKLDLDNIYLSFTKNKKNNTIVDVKVGKVLNDTINMDENIIGRGNEINNIMEILLRKKKNNPLLIGEAGVGKTAIVEEFTRMINKKLVPKKLIDYKIISIEMANLVAGTKYRGEFEEKITKILEEVSKNEKTILFIDEIHTLINAGGAEGAVSAGDIFKPHLARSNIKCIGATTIYEYEKYLAKDKALCRRFENIMIKEPTLDETKTIINNVKNEYEAYHNVKISNSNIEEIINCSNRYIYNKKNPDKTLDFLDSICSKVTMKNDDYKIANILLTKLNELKKQKEKAIQSNDFYKASNYKNEELKIIKKLEQNNKNNKNKITSKDIKEVLIKKANITFLDNVDQSIIKLKYNLENNIIGQKGAIEKINNIILEKLNKIDNISINLLLGMQGSGKTKTIKEIIKVFDNTNIIHINGEEYTNDNSINHFIGISAGYVGYNEETLFTKLKYNPYSIIVVENFDKLNSSIKNLFKIVKEKGYILDSKREKIILKGCFILATITENKKSIIGFNSSEQNEETSYLNTFTNVIQFDQVTKEDVINYLNKKNLSLDLINKINYHKTGLKYIDDSELILN